MKTKDMVAYYVLGITDYIDELCDKFPFLYFTSDYLEEVITLCYPNHLKSVGNTIIHDLFEDIINHASKELGMDYEKFDYYVDGCCSNILYNNTPIHTMDELLEFSESEA